MKNTKESFEMYPLKIKILIKLVNFCMNPPEQIIQLCAKKFNKFLCVGNQFFHLQKKNNRQSYEKTRKTTIFYYYSTIYYTTTYLLLNLLTYYLLNYTKKCETLVKLWLNFFVKLQNCVKLSCTEVGL